MEVEVEEVGKTEIDDEIGAEVGLRRGELEI